MAGTWSWAGDGGIIAFARDHQARAVRFAIELQSTVPVFNLSASGSPTGDMALRLGIDSGRVKFCIETGTIVSDVINYAAYLEKSSTLPGTVSISRAVSDALPPGGPRSSASAGSSRRRISSARSGVWTPCSARSLAGAKNDSPEGEETMSAQGRIIP